jgi:archaemetzincin
MSFTPKVIIGVIISLFIGFGLFYVLNSSEKTTIEKVKDSIIALDSLHHPMDEPYPGEWLSAVKESGQTFEQYVNNKPNKKTKNRNKLYIRPIGNFSIAEKAVIQLSSKYLEKFYNTPVEILDSISTIMIPKESKRIHQNNNQASAKYILDSILSPNIPSDAAAYIAFTKIDLYNNPKKNFVFGLGSLKNRVGAYSLARFGDLENSPAEDQKYLLRTLKVASHELGHVFSIKHCTAYRCIMNGSNSMTESDSKPVYLCPIDVMKISWNMDIPRIERFEQLETFWEENGFTQTAAFYRKSAALIDSFENK